MKKLLTFILILISVSVFSKNVNVDSLELASKSTKQDTSVCNALHTLSGHYMTSDYRKAIQYAKTELVLAQKLGDQKRMARSFAFIGTGLYMQGDYDKALTNYINSIKIYELAGDKANQADMANSIGNIYQSMSQFKKALEYYQLSAKLAQESGNEKFTSRAYIGIAVAYDQMKDKSNAEQYYLKSLEIFERLGMKSELTAGYANAGVFYFNNNEIQKAIIYDNKALQLGLELKDNGTVGVIYNNTGDVYAFKKDYLNAIDYYNKALVIAKQLQYKQLMQACYQSLSQVYEKLNNASLALQYHKLLMDIKDSLFTEQNSKQIADINTKYETEKKDKQILQKENQISKQEAQANQHQAQMNILFAGLIILLLVIFFVIRGLRRKQKTNRELGIKNQKIETAYKVIEEKKKEITDSINYALRIQQAILPSVSEIKKSLDAFVLFQPKDIVSGDFYYFENRNAGRSIIAAADCTGHGVPGAMMSMVGMEKLKESIANNSTPGNILSGLNVHIKDSLHQSENSTKDGMDMALCVIDHNTKKILYSGANRSMLVIRKGSKEIEEIKSDKTAIGGYTDESFEFHTHEISANEGDCFYIFSDGYADQFGGFKNKKFSTAKLKDILTIIHEQSMDEQQEYLKLKHDIWRGEEDQTDDVLVIGFRM
jgi:serine phosphatase RsbU (regulator of sigma subunit)